MNIRRDKIKDAVYERRYVYSTHYHLIWCTKYRNQIFKDQKLADEMKELLVQIAQDNDILIEKMEVMPEHIHLLISFKPYKAASSVIKALKGRSAFLFFQNHPEIKKSQMWGGHLWSSSYYFGTVGNMSKEVVEKYINDQIYNAQKEKKPYPSTH
ncbi:IS200/IS605 family transposase [Lactobacillus sp. LL6]|uniref:IS200/IS605 family transposase n=1 Tax=Lactobacillus sp. LL6 TaxID=2596827 RepID=UPI0011847D09|nr:IS200/IS605 family transposase [Lactobacillus sp. LL6]TSO27063.1 IS200/IS605 family transposase [Lactobacillus sp. LL6]TSO27080.1 IS200/IS605 family transposase [Lactobacillus sp. LL6]